MDLGGEKGIQVYNQVPVGLHNQAHIVNNLFHTMSVTSII